MVYRYRTKMDEDRKGVTEKMLEITLEIVYLLTGLSGLLSNEENMKNLFSCTIILLHLQSVFPAQSCEETGDVFAMFGEQVILRLSVVETQKIRQVLWISSRGFHFATSRPGGLLEIRENSYKDRLDASSDGSLIIKDLKMTDGGIVKATIRLLDGEDCAQTYNLSVTGRCGETRMVSAQVGGNVTLLVEKSLKENLYWERPGGIDLATTKPGGFFRLGERQYNGRLLGSQNGSLTITNVAAPDQGVYRAVILPPGGTGCMQLYNVSITEQSVKTESGAVNVIPSSVGWVTLSVIFGWISL